MICLPLSAPPFALTVDEEKKNATFLNQLITKVVDNLQVSINNIHLRYEDKLSDPKVCHTTPTKSDMRATARSKYFIFPSPSYLFYKFDLLTNMNMCMYLAATITHHK